MSNPSSPEIMPSEKNPEHSSFQIQFDGNPENFIIQAILTSGHTFTDFPFRLEIISGKEHLWRVTVCRKREEIAELLTALGQNKYLEIIEDPETVG